MPVDMFLEIRDVNGAIIKGESMVKGHEGEIDIESFSFGQAADASDTGQRAGKVALQDYHFVMNINSASPTLMKYCADGKHLKEALLSVRTAGTIPVEFLMVKFVDVMISSFQNAGASADLVPMDQFSMWFAKVELEYRPQDAKGGLGQPVYFKWDRIKGESYP